MQVARRFAPMSPLSDDRDDLEPGEAMRACVEELGKLHTDYARAQVYATAGPAGERWPRRPKQIRLASRR